MLQLEYNQCNKDKHIQTHEFEKFIEDSLTFILRKTEYKIYEPNLIFFQGPNSTRIWLIPLCTFGRRHNNPDSYCKECLACWTCREHHGETFATRMKINMESCHRAVYSRVHMVSCHCHPPLDCIDKIPDRMQDR